MKQIFTKTQAVAALIQVKEGKEFNIHFKPDSKHSLFKQSCLELEKKLIPFVNPDDFAGVVEDPTPPQK